MCKLMSALPLAYTDTATTLSLQTRRIRVIHHHIHKELIYKDFQQKITKPQKGQEAVSYSLGVAVSLRLDKPLVIHFRSP